MSDHQFLTYETTEAGRIGRHPALEGRAAHRPVAQRPGPGGRVRPDPPTRAGHSRSGSVPPLLRLTALDARTYRVTQPEESAEGRDVVFSGQLLGQVIMASDAAASGTKDIRSIHAIFARAGTYTRPIELAVDSMHAGRTWASDTVTAMQDGKLLTRALVLLNDLDPDLMRHGRDMPDAVPGPHALEPGPWQCFPGSEVRPVLVAAVHQDSMARAADRPLDPKRAM